MHKKAVTDACPCVSLLSARQVAAREGTGPPSRPHFLAVLVCGWRAAAYFPTAEHVCSRVFRSAAGDDRGVGGCVGSGGGDGAARGEPYHPVLHVRDFAQQRPLAGGGAGQHHCVRAAVNTATLNSFLNKVNILCDE